jgi:hypothetical protein
MFEISEFETTDTADMPLKNPKTGKQVMLPGGKAPATITLAGRDSEIYRKISRDLANKRAEAARAAGSNDFQPSDEDLESEALDLLTALTIGWNGISANKEPFPFSVENARKLYERLPWLREEVDRFVGNRANFMKA